MALYIFMYSYSALSDTSISQTEVKARRLHQLLVAGQNTGRSPLRRGSLGTPFFLQLQGGAP